VLCGWLSDRIGRRPVLLAGLILGCLSILPVFHGLMHYGNPALESFNRDVAVVLRGDACHYNPFTGSRNDCERNQELLAKLGVSYTLQNASETSLQIAAQPDISGFQTTTVTSALKSAGWPEHTDAARVNSTMIFLLLLIPLMAVALITGPQTATLAELFPARTRYTAVALPHNLSAGWIGGLSPFMITLLGVNAGDPTAGLWYPVGLLIMASVVGLLFLPETRNTPLDE
jgi:MFS family permease